VENKISKLAVMFVDDEPQVLKAIRRVVRHEQYDTRFAEGAIQALEILKQTQVQVVVSDLSMPEMDGLALLKRVQQDYPETIRIVLSAVTDIDPILQAIHVGKVYRYITKPYDERELVMTVRQALDAWMVQKEKHDLQAQLAEHNRSLETRVKERTEQLLAIERQAELGRYAAQIVHNLKGPLQVVFGQLSLAKLSLSRDDRSSEGIELHLSRMEAAVDNLARIVSGILRHAKNTAQYDNEWTQLNQIIKNELQFFEVNETFKYDVEKQIHLTTDLPSVWANPLHLQQIVDNLINNALDAMVDCQSKILVITTHAENGYAIMTICDNGAGIDSKHLPLIFQPEFTTKPPDKGTGLGLASVKTMVEGYGGRVEVQSNFPQGAKFVVILPLKQCSPGSFH